MIPGRRVRHGSISRRHWPSDFEAHLIGLHTALTPLAPPGGGYFERFDRSLLDPLYREFSDRMVEREKTAQSLFGEVAAKRRLAAEWRTSAGYPSEDVALHGRYVDLVILGQTDPDNIETALFSPRPEEIALAVGRPVLVVPYAGRFEGCGRRVLVAWNASRAATRAINDAMPLLAGAETVTVLSVDPSEDSRAHGEVPGMDIAVHLARHGVKADVKSTVSGGIGVGNALCRGPAISGPTCWSWAPMAIPGSASCCSAERRARSSAR